MQDIYPTLRGAALFFVDMLVEDPRSHYLVTAPTTSPENAYILPNGQVVNICAGSTMDNQIVRELFSNTIDAAHRLGVDSAFAEELVAKRARLMPTKIGKDGRIMEWLEPFKEAEPHHRHVSHLYGLFVTLAFKDKDITENVIYEKLLNDKLSANLGYVYENMIAQMLRASGKDLYYHTIPYAEGKKYYEVDFLISDRHKIAPIEVKSSGYKSHKSLDEFSAKYSERIMNRYVIYTKDYKRENGVEYLPVYMTMFI